jgi:hypothetical protein
MFQPNWGIEHGVEPLPIRTSAVPLAHTSPVERTASPVATAVPSALKRKKRAAPDAGSEDDDKQPATKKLRVADGKRATGTWTCDICGWWSEKHEDRCQAVDDEGTKVCKGRQGHNCAKVQY